MCSATDALSCVETTAFLPSPGRQCCFQPPGYTMHADTALATSGAITDPTVFKQGKNNFLVLPSVPLM